MHADIEEGALAQSRFAAVIGVALAIAVVLGFGVGFVVGLRLPFAG